MISLLRRNPMIAFLGVAAAALALILLAEVAVLGGAAAPAKPTRAAAADAKLLPPVPAVVPDQAYPETTARPLFIATRRPAPEVTAAAPAAFQRGQFTLQGVIVAGSSRTAMLREKTSGKVHRVDTGAEVNGIKVVQIDPTSVTLGVGEEREVVPLTVQRPGAPPAATAAITPGPFAPPPSAFPQPAFPAAAAAQVHPPGMAQPLGAGGVARPGDPAVAPQAATPAAPGAPVGTAPPGTPQAGTAPMTPEELLARRRARRAQQNQ